MSLSGLLQQSAIVMRERRGRWLMCRGRELGDEERVDALLLMHEAQRRERRDLNPKSYMHNLKDRS